MYKIGLRLARNQWLNNEFVISRNDLALAYVSAIRKVKMILDTELVDFIPVGDGEFIVWANGKCQGIMSIEEHVPVGRN